MPLQFVLGRAGSGKSEYCVKQAAQAEEKGLRTLMIVPEQYSHQGESAFLNEKGYIHDDFNVTSFGRLAKKLIAGAGLNHNSTDGAGKAMLVLRAFGSCKNKLVFYRTAADKQGLIRLFMDAVSELKKGQVPPEALRAAAEKTEEHLFSARLRDLSYIYEAYNKLLSESISDSDDNLTLMASLCFDSDYIKNANIFIDEFYRFTQNELACIEAFLAVGASVTVALTMPGEYVPPNSVFASANNTKKALERIAQNVGAKVLPPVVLNLAPRFSSPELSVLEQAMSGKKAVWKTDAPADVSLYVAKGKYEEVVYAAAAIKKFVKETGASYREIAVITGDYDGYADLVQSVFPLYDIPVFADTRRDFLNHPIVLYLFSLFDLLSGVTTKRVTAYMKSGFADISEEEAFRLENYALAGAVEFGDWLSDERFLRKARGVFDSEDAQTDEAVSCLEVKNRLLKSVLLLKETITAAKTVGGRIAAFLSFFEATHLQEKIEQLISKFQAEGLLRQADEYTEVYNILTQTFSLMEELLGNETIGLSGMRAILEAGLSQKSIGVIPTVYDQVSFGDLNRSVIKNVRAAFVIGANDGIFPPAPAPSALLSDSEREFLLSQGISVAPDAKKLISDAEFSVYTAVNICREKLFVSYPVGDDFGGGLRPSMFISKLKRTFPGLKASNELSLKEQRPETTVASKQSAYTYVLTHMGQLGENDAAKALFSVLMKDEAYRQRLERAQRFFKYTNTAGKLSNDTVLNLYGSSLYGSVSRFERYSACPFSFFIEYGLKAKERKVLKVEAPDIGSLLHEIIERFSAEMKKQNLSFRTITPDEQREMTDAIIENLFGTMFIKNMYSAGRLEALKKRLKSLVSKSVWAICEHVARGEFEPAAFEVKFDKNGELPPVTVTLPGGGEVTMSGRIDRIDTLSRGGKLYLKVIDYKSGAKGYSLADIFNGTTLQLAVYMAAAAKGIAEKTNGDTEFGGMFYFRLDDPVLDSTPETGADNAKDIKAFKMSGLSSDDPEVIRAIDGEISGWSAVIPVYLKSDGTVSKSQSKTASREQFETLNRYIHNTLIKIGQEIMGGNVDIRPVKSGKALQCSFCKYVSVCGFDPNIHPCRRAFEFSSDDEVWNKMN